MAGTESTTAAGQELPLALEPAGPVALALGREAAARDPAEAGELKKTLLQQLGYIRSKYGCRYAANTHWTPSQRFFDALRDHANPPTPC